MQYINRGNTEKMKGKIHEHPNANANGFDKRPHQAGRKPSIKKEIAQILEANGVLTFDDNDIIEYKEGEYVKVKVPQKKAVAMKVMKWAMSNKAQSIKAIQMLLEHFDGKPTQTLNHLSDSQSFEIPITEWVSQDNGKSEIK